MTAQEKKSYIIMFNDIASKDATENKGVLETFLKKENVENQAELGKCFNRFNMMVVEATDQALEKINAAPNVDAVEPNRKMKLI